MLAIYLACLLRHSSAAAINSIIRSDALKDKYNKVKAHFVLASMSPTLAAIRSI